MLRKLALLAGALLIVLLLAWGALLAWANSGALEAELESGLARESGLAIEITGLRVGPLLGVEAAELAVRDPGARPFLSLAKVALGWRFPWSAGASFWALAGGGRVELSREAWEGWRPGRAAAPPGGVAPAPPGLPRLAVPGGVEVEDGELFELGWSGLEGRLVSALHGLDLPYTQGRGRLTIWRSGKVVLEDAGLSVGPAVPVELGLVGRGEELELSLKLAPPRLDEFMALPPWGIQALGLGLSGEGSLALETRLKLARGVLLGVEGTLVGAKAALRLGSERVLGPIDGRWAFAGNADGIAGEVALERLELAVMGLPLAFEGLSGRLELGEKRIRLARARAKSWLGPARLAWQGSWSESAPGWELVVEAGGAGHWLQAGTLLAGSAGVAVKGARIGPAGRGVELAAVLSPLELRPPSWEIGSGRISGSLPAGERIAWEELAGKFYLDTQGSYSFETAGPAGQLLGQLVPDGGFRLWATPAGGTQQALAWPPPTRE